MEGVIDQAARRITVADLEDDQLPRLRVPELREELRRRNLWATGQKPELLARLRAALLVERTHLPNNDEENIADLVDDEEEDDIEDARAVNAEGLPGRGNHDVRLQNPVDNGQGYNDEDNDDGANSERANRTPVTRRREELQVLLTSEDIEGSLEKFSGDDHTNFHQWLDDFEEMAELCKWNEIQKIAYAKRLLDGSAKMVVNYECAKTWKKLKESLTCTMPKEQDDVPLDLSVKRGTQKASSKPPGFKCERCSQTFSLSDRLAKSVGSLHRERAPESTRAYACDVCRRRFALPGMLTRHARLHTGIKPYSCSVCGQVFSRSDHLAKHQRTHTGEKPYHCPSCPYAASRRDMITRHMRTHKRQPQPTEI